MDISPVSGTAAAAEAERVMLVLKKHQDVAKTVAASLVSLVRGASPAPPGRIDTYA